MSKVSKTKVIDHQRKHKIESLKLSVELAKRYISAASEYILQLETDESYFNYSITGAGVKRVGLDLTRVLAQSRKPIKKLN